MDSKPTKEEINAFYTDTQAHDHRNLDPKVIAAGLYPPASAKPCEATRPLFGEKFRDQLVTRLEKDAGPVEARKTYDAIEQETVTYVANFIKDSILAVFKKVKRR